MIKINLLPYRDIQKKEKVMQQLIMMLGCLILSIIIVVAVELKVRSIEAQFNKIKEDTTKEIADLDKKLGQIDKIKSQKSEIERKLSVIQLLNKNRTTTVNLIFKIAEATPERVWLSSIKDSPKDVIVDGEALTANDVSDYMERLGKVGLFQKVNLNSLEQIQKADRKVIKFNLNLQKV